MNTTDVLCHLYIHSKKRKKNNNIFKYIYYKSNFHFKIPYTLLCIICVHILIFSAKMSPLESIDRSQVTLLPVSEATGIQEGARAIIIPDVNTLVC